MSFQNCKIVATGADPQKYHVKKGKRGTGDFAMSASAIKEFARCPSRWVAGYEMPASKSLRFGSLLDCRLLTPEHYDARFAVRPHTYMSSKGEEKPWSGNSNTCKEWLRVRAGIEIVSAQEVVDVDRAIDRALDDSILKSFLDASDKQVWVEGEWADPVNGVVVPVKALLDLAPRKDTEFATCLGDLKSTANAEVLSWQRFCFTAGYHLQAAWNTGIYNAATDEDRDTFCFLLVENFEPWQPARRMLSRDFLKFGTSEINRLMHQYCGCVKAGFWPGYDDTDEATQGWSVVNAEPWMESKAIFAPTFEIPGVSETDNDPEWVKGT